MKVLTESLKYKDMKEQVTPILGIDEFKSRIGNDSDIIVLNFIVASSAVGNDLVDWLERGYDWVIDAEISPGEVLDKKFYVFAEMNRRSTAPRRIMEVLEDLFTLTDIKAEDWEISIDNEKHPASQEFLEKAMLLSPMKYKQSMEGELNEWRERAGLKTVPLYDELDQDLLNFQRQAGIR